MRALDRIIESLFTEQERQELDPLWLEAMALAITDDPAKGTKLLLLDNFIETSDVAIASHTPDYNRYGNAWASAAGTWTVQSDGSGLRHASAHCEDAAIVDVTVSDVIITMITDPSHNQGDQGVAFRYSALDAFYFYDYQGGGMRIVKFNPGGSVIGTNTGDPTYGGAKITWQVTLSGNDIKCEVIGVADTLIEVTDSDLASNTKHGIRHCLESADLRYDQITIERN